MREEHNRGIHTITIHGTEYTLYTIEHLSTAIGRASDTVRKWEIAGTLPRTVFIGPRNTRLYTQEMIDAVVENAEKHGVGQGKPISRTTFSRDVGEAWTEIYKACGLVTK